VCLWEREFWVWEEWSRNKMMNFNFNYIFIFGFYLFIYEFLDLNMNYEGWRWRLNTISCPHSSKTHKLCIPL
jgi:hypothetical protein